MRELEASIRKHGLLEPIVVTSNWVIISGHRRHTACQMAGLKEAPCRVLPISSFHPLFVKLLREHNRQRIKSLDEVLREEVVSLDPAEAYQALIAHRQAGARVEAEVLNMGAVKRRATISKAKLPMQQAAIDVLNELRDFWPLTDRKIHYELLNDPPLRHASKPGSRYRNDERSYKDLCDLLTRARISGRIPFTAIDDPTRPCVVWQVDRSPATFIARELNELLKGYCRDLMQSQPNHIEIVGEKLTVAGIIRPVAMKYTIPYSIGRGDSDIGTRCKIAKRYQDSGKERLILLLLGDFDPDGEKIVHAFARSLRDDFGIKKLDAIKMALTLEQARRFGLPEDMEAKKTSSSYREFFRKYRCEHAWELEALRPRQLQELLEEAIDGVIDTAVFNAELDQERRDAGFLDGVRSRLSAAAKDIDGLAPNEA